jgi:hypothetical protein
MTHPLFTIDEATRAKNAGAVWLILGIPIGCGIGIALHNLALGVGIGLFLGATIAVTGSWGERPLDLRRPRAQP